jgi:hypothetical protein
MLPWDHWGLARDARIGSGLTEATLARIDAVAALTGAADRNWTALRETYDREDALPGASHRHELPEGSAWSKLT